MFVIKNFCEEDLEVFFDLFYSLGIVEIQADYMGQDDLEEFNFYCWNRENEDIEITDQTLFSEEYKQYIDKKHAGSLPRFLDTFLKSCIPLDYKDNFGSFGMIKFKMEERDYEIIKFEYSERLYA